MGTDEYLSRREAADLAGVHYNTMRLWEKTGRLTPHKVADGNVMIERAELEVVMAERRQEAPSETRQQAAALQAEVKGLREQLAFEREERIRLLNAILEIARGRDDRDGDGDKMSA